MNYESCEICLESFEQLEIAERTLCGHVFHVRCIRSWIASGVHHALNDRKVC